MRKRPKVKLKYLPSDTLVLIDPMSDIVRDLGLTLAVVISRIEPLVEEIDSVNPNRDPIKFSVKERWSDELKRVLRESNAALEKIPELYHVRAA